MTERDEIAAAKAVLDTYGFEMNPTVRKALAAMIAEVERRDAPLDGTTAVSGLAALADVLERQDYPDDAETCQRGVAYIERQAAALAVMEEGLEIFESIVGRLQADDEWPHILDGHAQDLAQAVTWFHARKARALTDGGKNG